jgi:transposase
VIFEVRTRTIYTWMNSWESEGIYGLMIHPGRGRKPKLSITDDNLVEHIKKNY